MKKITALILTIGFVGLIPADNLGAKPTKKTVAKKATKVPLPKRKMSKLGALPKVTLKTENLDLKGDLKALNKLKLTASEQDILDNALKAIYKRNTSKAQNLKSQLKSPIAIKLVDWYELRSKDLIHSPQNLQNFLEQNPAWPSASRLNAKLEVAKLKGHLNSKETLKRFKSQAPKTRAGKIALAEALLEKGEKEKAIPLIRETYQNPRLSKWLEKRIIDRHKTHLRTKDHKIRLDRLLYQDRRSKIAPAMRAAKYLSKNEKQAANFRAAVIRRRLGGARKLLAKLDKQTKAQPGVYLARVQLARRSKKSKQAANLLINSKFKPAEITEKDQWWIERRINTRDAINNNNYERAYKIASNHEIPSVNHFNEAEFLSGWLALRFLKKPELAEQHFTKFKASADGPRTKSKSTYWLGRCQTELKKHKEAKENFKESATLFNTYYGQLASYELKDKSANITIPEPPTITPQEAENFTSREEIKAIAIAHLSGQKSIAKVFFGHLRYHLKEPADLKLLAELAASLGYNQSTVRIGKTAMAQKIPLTEYAYPIRFMPKYQPLRSVPEQAIVYSIARQESEFNYQIKSRAGARGLLQVMPATLRYMARKYNIKHSTKWLTQKPAFNAKIGSAYIGDRHEEFGGSYIMTFAGFNAGPGRVRQWIKKFGDPRSKDIDAIDWVERIPFTETRNYVQKVLANLQVYRARLKDGKSVIMSHNDLQRGQF